MQLCLVNVRVGGEFWQNVCFIVPHWSVSMTCPMNQNKTLFSFSNFPQWLKLNSYWKGVVKESCSSASYYLRYLCRLHNQFQVWTERVKVLIISNYRPIISENGFIVQIHQPGCQNRSEISQTIPHHVSHWALYQTLRPHYYISRSCYYWSESYPVLNL